MSAVLDDDQSTILDRLYLRRDGRTKGDLLLAAASKQKMTFVGVEAFHLLPGGWTPEHVDDDGDVVTWSPKVELGKFSGVGVSISLDMPHATLVRLLRKSLTIMESATPEMWDATRREIASWVRRQSTTVCRSEHGRREAPEKEHNNDEH